MEQVAAGKATNGVCHPVCAWHAQGVEQNMKLKSEWTGRMCHLDQYIGSERRGPRDDCPWTAVRERLLGRRTTASFATRHCRDD